MQSADVMVIGLGAMGSAATYQLAKRGVSVIGIDRFDPPHIYGSTHGDTRITRQAIGEGEEYVPLVLRSHEIWREIEAEANADLFVECGGLILSTKNPDRRHGVADFFATTVSAAERYGIEHEVLTSATVSERFPLFRLDGDYRCYYEPGAGYVRPEQSIRAQLHLAELCGAEILRNTEVINVDATTKGVTVRTVDQTLHADTVILATGPWLSKLAGNPLLDQLCKPYRQVLQWFALDGSPASSTASEMPVYIWESGDGLFYGFPAVDGPQGGLKVAAEQYDTTTDADHMELSVSTAETDAMFDRYIRDRLPVERRTVRSARCLYTVTPDYRFIIDKHPEHNNVLLASPCSGHGFKHSAAIGESLAQWAVDGASEIDLSAFRISRFQS